MSGCVDAVVVEYAPKFGRVDKIKRWFATCLSSTGSVCISCRDFRSLASPGVEYVLGFDTAVPYAV